MLKLNPTLNGNLFALGTVSNTSAILPQLSQLEKVCYLPFLVGDLQLLKTWQLALVSK